VLPRELFELVLHLLAIRLGIARSRCHRWRSHPRNEEDKRAVRLDLVALLFQVGPKRFSGFICQIDGAQLPALVANSDLAGLFGEVLHLIQSEPTDITGPAACIVAEREHGLASQIFSLDQLPEDVPLVRREFSWCKQLLRRELDAPGWVACEELLIDEPFSALFLFSLQFFGLILTV